MSDMNLLTVAKTAKYRYATLACRELMDVTHPGTPWELENSAENLQEAIVLYLTVKAWEVNGLVALVDTQKSKVLALHQKG